MRLHRSSRSLRRLLAAGCVPWLLAACSVAGRAPAGAERLSSWSEGPVTWLLLPDERRRLRRIDSSVAAVYFIEGFWSRRDPDPTDSANPAREKFHKRVDAADQLYGEQGRRGSLSDRGRALILLGSPSHLHVTSRPVLAWDAREARGERVTQEHQSYEIWGYRLEELEPALVDLVSRRGGAEALRLQLTFARGENRTYLTEGDDLLELAARALVVEESG